MLPRVLTGLAIALSGTTKNFGLSAGDLEGASLKQEHSLEISGPDDSLAKA